VIQSNQAFVAVICKGPSGHSLNSSFQTRSSHDYMLDLGNAIVNFARIVPDGLLVFFPSYNVMDICLTAWQSMVIFFFLFLMDEYGVGGFFWCSNAE